MTTAFDNIHGDAGNKAAFAFAAINPAVIEPRVLELSAGLANKTSIAMDGPSQEFGLKL